MRTEEEIEEKIKELSTNPDNFANSFFYYDEDGEYEKMKYSKYNTDETLKNFANWLLNKEQ
jgi:hypothetical protein